METNKKYHLLGYFYLSVCLLLTIVGLKMNAFDFLYTFITVSTLTIGSLSFFGEKGIAAATYISRILVGSLFVVSGLIKANDPLGFSYKLEEYFAESALNWPFFEPYSLPLAILVASSEIILGFAVLFGGKSKLTAWSLLGMILFFSWLTFYTAQCDPNGTYTVIENGIEVEHGVTCVTDCGCFGDALKGSIGRSLTPWESFKKDILLLVFVILLLIRSSFITLNSKTDDLIILPLSIIFVIVLGGILFGWWLPLVYTLITFALYFIIKRFSTNKFDKDWQLAIMASVLSFGFSWWCLTNLPQKDFRPYAINKSIPEQMKSAEELGLKPPVYATQFTFTDTITGKDSIVLSTDWMKIYKKPWFAKFKIKTWEGAQVTVSEGYEPPIMGFNIGDEQQTEAILHSENPVFILVSYDITHANTEVQKLVNELVEKTQKKGLKFYGATASQHDKVEAFKLKNGNTFEYLEGDEKILKTLIRSNPGLLILKNGVVIGKWHYNNFPIFDELQNEYLK